MGAAMIYPTKTYADEDQQLPEEEFSDCTTAEQAVYGVDLANKTAIVTGGTSGIGREVARVLALRGARVIVAARSRAKGEAAAEKLREETKADDLTFMALDLSSPASIKAFAEALGDEPVHILVLNAGVFGVDGRVPGTGLEKTFAINHMGHFALTKWLMPRLEAAQGAARVVVVSSNAHRSAPTLEWGKITDAYETSKDADFYRYGMSKLCNILFARELHRRFDALWACSLHPGSFIPSEIGRERWWAYYGMKLALPFVRTVEQGAATTVRCAVDERLGAEVGGRYFADCKVCAVKTAVAESDEEAAFLWEESERIFADAYENPN